jgi:hypothetical protein
MRRLKGILIVLVIFMCGVLLGGAIGSSAALVDLVNKTVRGGPVNIRRMLVQRAKHDLKLDEEQSHQFWQIMNETGVELRDATAPVRPQIEAVLLRSSQRMRDVLRPEQRVRFDGFVSDFQKRWIEAMKAAPVKDPASAAPGSP